MFVAPCLGSNSQFIKFMVKPYYIYGFSVYYIYGPIFITFMVSGFIAHFLLLKVITFMVNIIFMVKFYYIYVWYYICGFYYIYG